MVATLEAGYLVDESLYVVTHGGRLFAMQAEVGLIRWAEKLVERDYIRAITMAGFHMIGRSIFGSAGSRRRHNGPCCTPVSPCWVPPC